MTCESQAIKPIDIEEQEALGGFRLWHEYRCNFDVKMAFWYNAKTGIKVPYEYFVLQLHHAPILLHEWQKRVEDLGGLHSLGLKVQGFQGLQNLGLRAYRASFCGALGFRCRIASCLVAKMQTPMTPQ